MQLNETFIRSVVEEVLHRLGTNGSGPAVASQGAKTGRFGLFTDPDEAVAAAKQAYEQLSRRTIEERRRMIDHVRRIAVEQCVELGTMEMQETKIGRLEHKIDKLRTLGERAPGVEFLRSEVFSGDHGLAVIEHAPFGVIGAVTPVTHSLPTATGNAISMIAAGNTVVFNPHPSGKRVAAEGIRRYNEAIYRDLGIDNLMCLIVEPTLESANRIFKHPDVAILCVTGGPGVARAAMQQAKRAVVAGPGNPPVVVDETADLDRAARAIIQGGAYDNNLLCIAEKEIVVVAQVADQLMRELEAVGCVRLTLAQMDQLAEKAFENGGRGVKEPVVNRQLVGRDAAVLAKAIGLELPASVPMLFGETPWDHPWVLAEQMMPCLPVIRVADVDAAIEMARKVEHGFRHTAIMHSKNVASLTKMGKVMNCTVFVKNGPSTAGLGLNGEGTFTHSIASPTGEGITTTRTWTRMRRCTMVDYLRII